MDLMDIRRGLMAAKFSRLPGLYQEVEYIETNGTGNKYIDSGIECTGDLAVKIKVQGLTNVNMALCGGIGLQNAPVYFRHHCSPYTETNRYWFQNNAESTTMRFSEIPWDAVLNIYVNPQDRSITINNITKVFEVLVDPDLTTGKNYGLMGRIASDGTVQTRPSKLWYAKFERNGATVGDFVPCYRKSDGEIGLYDLITKQFFAKTGGTGNFTKGPNV